MVINKCLEVLVVKMNFSSALKYILHIYFDANALGSSLFLLIVDEPNVLLFQKSFDIKIEICKTNMLHI